MSAADSQSFLAIAYWVSFYLEGRCTLTAYHYSLSLDVGLVSCSTFVVSAAIVHGYSDAPLAALLRYAVAFVSLVILSLYVVYQHGQLNAPEQWPRHKSTSALFLPSACFLDSRLNNTIFPESTDQDHDRIIDIIGPPDNAKVSGVFSLWIANVIMFGLGFIKNLILVGIMTYRNRRVAVGNEILAPGIIWSICFFRFCSICVYLVTCLYAATHIIWIRKFVHDSHWLALDLDGTSGESNFNHIGQILPLLTFTAIFIALADLWKPRKDSDLKTPTDQELDSFDS